MSKRSKSGTVVVKSRQGYQVMIVGSRGRRSKPLDEFQLPLTLTEEDKEMVKAAIDKARGRAANSED